MVELDAIQLKQRLDEASKALNDLAFSSRPELTLQEETDVWKAVKVLCEVKELIAPETAGPALLARLLSLHTALARIDDDGRPDEIGFWHLLFSLVEYCDSQSIDLVGELADVLSEYPSIKGREARVSATRDHFTSESEHHDYVIQVRRALRLLF